MIKRYRNHEINREEWDEIISRCDTPMVYALSWYLDIVSPGWEAWMDDNRFIMPIPVKSYFGIRYLVQPPFCQKLNIYGIGAGHSIKQAFYKKINRSFLYFNLQLNDSIGLHHHKYLNGRINYTLDLTPGYTTLQKDFHENTLRNLRKAQGLKLTTEHGNTRAFVSFCSSFMKGIAPGHQELFGALVTELQKRGIARLYFVFQEKEIISCACFIEWNYRLLYLAGASSPEGKNKSAMFRIFDQVLQDYAGSGFLLDFEGSMIPGVARFFRGFGASSEYYYHLKKYFFVFR